MVNETENVLKHIGYKRVVKFFFLGGEGRGRGEFRDSNSGKNKQTQIKIETKLVN